MKDVLRRRVYRECRGGGRRPDVGGGLGVSRIGRLRQRARGVVVIAGIDSTGVAGLPDAGMRY